MPLKQTPLHALHEEYGARMVPFAGYQMPVQYNSGIIAEHLHTRDRAALFDVSHMGQFVLAGDGVTQTLESLVPADLEQLAEHRQCYTLLTNARGGVRDDLIVTRWSDTEFLLVVNAACKDEDRAYLEASLTQGQSLRELDGHGLLALQGPLARQVLGELLPGASALTFLQGGRFSLDDHSIYVTCSGYTGEDGFELSMAAEAAEPVARRLLENPQVLPTGLGARDSLRLEAGLCLYGHELSQDISPVEARLAWCIGKARRPDGARAGGYPGADRIAGQLSAGTERVRVGLVVQGRRPVREGQLVVDGAGQPVGEVSSGGFGPSVGSPVAMAFVSRAVAETGTTLFVDVKGKQIPVTVSKLPLVPQRYFRG